MILYEYNYIDGNKTFTPIEIDDNDYYEILSFYEENWLNMLTATTSDVFDFYSKQTKLIERKLYQEKRKLYCHFRYTSDGYRQSRRKQAVKEYNHNYYEQVTKVKRKAKREAKK